MWPKENKLVKKIFSVKINVTMNNYGDTNLNLPKRNSFNGAEAPNISPTMKPQATSTSNRQFGHSASKIESNQNAASHRYMEIYFNYEIFYCVLCTKQCEPGNGILLQQCCHSVCIACIIEAIKHNSDGEVNCPYSRTYEKCEGVMLYSEIRNLLSEDELSKFVDLSLKQTRKEHQSATMDELIQLDDIGAVENKSKFECPICLTAFTGSGQGIILRNCFHTFCKACLVYTVENSEDIETKCPYVYEDLNQCAEIIEQREIKAVLSVVSFEKYLARDISRSELRIQNTFHCLTPNCHNFFIVEPGDTNFICSVCQQDNCIVCKEIHMGVTCAEHNDEADGYTKQTMKFIDQSVLQKEMMACSRCQNYVIKNGGCNHMTCLCGNEFQWHGME